MSPDDKQRQLLSKAREPWRFRVHEIIFEADTPAGKTFDVILLLLICLSVLVVMLDSVADIHQEHRVLLMTTECSAEMVVSRKRGVSTQACPSCSAEGHDIDAKHCKYCGAKL